MKLLETVVALSLGLLLGLAVWRGAASVRGQVARLESAAEDADAARVVGLLLDMDAPGFQGGDDRGELAVRAFRWWAVVCGADGATGALAVRWRGLRRPDPAKDSALVVAGDGERFVRGLRSASRGGGCGGAADQFIALELLPGDAVPVLVRGFERGSYRLDDAFRYRRGRGGAQPLTASVFDPDSVRMAPAGRRMTLSLGRRPVRRWTW